MSTQFSREIFPKPPRWIEMSGHKMVPVKLHCILVASVSMTKRCGKMIELIPALVKAPPSKVNFPVREPYPKWLERTLMSYSPFYSGTRKSGRGPRQCHGWSTSASLWARELRASGFYSSAELPRHNPPHACNASRSRMTEAKNSSSHCARIIRLEMPGSWRRIPAAPSPGAWGYRPGGFSRLAAPPLTCQSSTGGQPQ